MFIDRVFISLSAGKGGNGIVAWRREKYIPKGGPAGGDGGNGGSILLEVDQNVLSLEDYRHKKIIKAPNGGNGGSSNKKGKNGKDLILKIPPGTLVKDKLTKKVLFDLTEKKQSLKICQGGKGGKGNIQFKSATNQAPNECTPGTEGKSLEIELELKIIADVGLVGFPNAGKSTIINQLAKTNVKIASYPFTTLIPNIGLIEFEDFSRILIADIPGLIKGAHKNRGLGFSFLKHIERSSFLVYVIDLSGIDGRDPIEDFAILQEELKSYNEEMTLKPFLVALNKTDTEESKANLKEFKKAFKLDKNLLFEISALTKKGLRDFTKAIKTLAQRNGKRFL